MENPTIPKLKVRSCRHCYTHFILSNTKWGQTSCILVFCQTLMNCIINSNPHPPQFGTTNLIKRSKPCVGWVCEKAWASKEKGKRKIMESSYWELKFKWMVNDHSFTFSNLASILIQGFCMVHQVEFIFVTTMNTVRPIWHPGIWRDIKSNKITCKVNLFYLDDAPGFNREQH